MLTKHGERCVFGVLCRFGLEGRCRGSHTDEEKMHFDMKTKIKEAEAAEACAYCVRRCCRFGARCRRGLRTDSDYDSSDEERELEARESEGEGLLGAPTCQDCVDDRGS